MYNDSLHSLYRRLKCYFVVCGLKCNFCISGRSWEDCANEVKIESCSSGKNRCGTLYGEKGSMKYYLKGCLSAKKCQSFELDSKGDLWNCNVICCKGDLCNGDHPQYHWPAQLWSSSMNAIFLPLYASRSRLLWDLITVIKSLNFADNNIPFFYGKVRVRFFCWGRFWLKGSSLFLWNVAAWTCSSESQGAV